MRLNEPAAKTRPRTKSTTEATKFSSSGGDLHLECSIYNLIGLLLLITTIMGGGFVQAKTIYDTLNSRIQGLEPLETSKVPLQSTAATPTAPAHAHIQVSTLRSSYGRQIAKLLLASFEMRLMHNYIIGFQLSCWLSWPAGIVFGLVSKIRLAIPHILDSTTW